VDVSHLKDVNLNDEVTLWGEGLPIEKIAAHMDCSPYGLLTGVSLRVRRIVVGLDEE
ncbi:MAG: alanine racemase, partial [Gammaproteobacteria bacterium]|nr:alanine racemase [Gammaproteobacteria bacterium]